MVDVFGNTDEMKKFIDDHPQQTYNVFDFDWSNCDDSVRYKKMFLSMFEKATVEAFLKFYNDWPREKMFSIEDFFVMPKPKNSRENGFFMLVAVDSGTNFVEAQTHPALKMLVPCCNPNIVVHSSRDALIFSVTRPIKAGNIIRSAMTPFFRKTEAKVRCYPDTCIACQNGWAAQVGDVMNDARENASNYFRCNDSKKLESWLNYRKVCIKFINKNADDYETDAKKRKMIAAKMIELENILFNIGNPFPASNHLLMLNVSSSDEEWDRYYLLMKFRKNLLDKDTQDEV